MANHNIDVRLEVPEMEPYEGKATQKQKQKIWELGFRDQQMIDGLGKKQASAIIDQLKSSIGNYAEKKKIKRNLLTGLSLILFPILLAVMAQGAGWAIIILMISGFIGVCMVIGCVIGWMASLFQR